MRDQMKMTAAGLTAVLMLMGVTGTVSAAEERRLTVQQTTIINYQPPANDLGVVVWMDRKEALYYPGEVAKVTVRPNRDAWITVVNVDAQGYTTVLFPNAYEPNNLVRGNEARQVCGNGSCNLGVSEPYGKNVVKVIASSTNTPVVENGRLVRSGAFADYQGGAEAFARRLTVLPAQAPQSQFAAASMVFSVVPRPMQQQQVQSSPQTQTQSVTLPDGSVVTQQVIVGGVVGGSTPAPAAAPLTSDFGLQLMPAKATYAQGEQFTMTATAEENCKLDMYVVDPNGSYNLVFKDVQLKAGKARFLPGGDSPTALTLKGLEGTHQLVGLCTKGGGGFFSGWFGGDQAEARSLYATDKNQPNIDSVIAGSYASDDKVGRSKATFTLLP